jgi:acyl phosphate:glycerol-3-phosphate acyltransferase
MTAAAAVLAAYALGCITTGYYVVRLATGDDLRRHATGSTGARNVGRRLGRRAAAVTLVLDMVRGAAAVAIALAAAGTGAAGAALVAVVGGHVAPVQLGFRGGRGLGPALGGMLVLDWRVALAGLAVAVVCTAATRAPTIAGLAGAVSAPVAALALGERETALAVGLAAAIIAAAHARPGSVRQPRS